MSETIGAKQGPDYLYFKFRSINKHLIESLVNSSLYFARPDELNDPFDCRPDLRKSLLRAASLATGRQKSFLQSALNDGQKFIESWKARFESFGICSFSLELAKQESTLMWAHYADRHKGVCLLYRFTESFLIDRKNNIFGVDTVQYIDDPFTNWLRDKAPQEMRAFIEGLVRISLTAKSPPWIYEHEARIIRGQHGLLNIPSRSLEQICFGLDTPESDIDLVAKLASEHCGCKSFCRIIREDSDFGIAAKEI